MNRTTDFACAANMNSSHNGLPSVRFCLFAVTWWVRSLVLTLFRKWRIGFELQKSLFSAGRLCARRVSTEHAEVPPRRGDDWTTRIGAAGAGGRNRTFVTICLRCRTPEGRSQVHWARRVDCRANIKFRICEPTLRLATTEDEITRR